LKKGDINDLESIEYYISKYKSFDLFTFDCGLDRKWNAEL
jgi:hypothetical protein